MADYLVQIAGTVGRDPEVKNGPKGDFTTLSVASNLGYGGERDDTRWYSVAFNDPIVQDFVRKNIRKGNAIVVEGYVNPREYNGSTYYNMSGFRVGFVEWFVKGRAQAAPAGREDEDL